MSLVIGLCILFHNCVMIIIVICCMIMSCHNLWGTMLILSAIGHKSSSHLFLKNTQLLPCRQSLKSYTYLGTVQVFHESTVKGKKRNYARQDCGCLIKHMSLIQKENKWWNIIQIIMFPATSHTALINVSNSPPKFMILILESFSYVIVFCEWKSTAWAV